MTKNDTPEPIWAHIAELRNTLIRVLTVVALSTALCFAFYQDLFSLLTAPFSFNTSPITQETLVHKRVANTSAHPFSITLPKESMLIAQQGAVEEQPSHYTLAPQGKIEYLLPERRRQLVIFGPVDGLLTLFSTCLWAGLVLSSPLWMFFLFQFISPALRKEERSLIFPFLFISFLFLAMGIAFAYTLTIPLANQFLETFNSTIGENLWSVSHYLDYTVNLMLANGLAFELTVILGFLVYYGILSRAGLIAFRRYAYVAIFILSAILTPPDVLTQLLLAFPLIFLYEGIIFCSGCIKRKGEIDAIRSMPS